VSKAETSSAFLFPNGAPEHVITNPESVEDWAKADVDVIVNADELPQWEALAAAAPIFHYYFPLIEGPNAEYPGVEALKQNIRLLGQMTGEPEAAEDAVGRYDRYIEAIAAAAPPEAAEQTVAFLQATDDGTYRTVSQDQLVILCDALIDAGLGKCIEGTESGAINAEDFLAQDPDWIVYSFGDHTERDDPVWGLLSAVKNDQVYDSDNWLVGESLRIIEHALQELAYHSLPESGIPDPGPMEDFDSASSPLAQGVTATPSS
jgi:ABC-type Fe3+-hydroxamate transport system substrate-binding protein